ncbi:putative glycosyltransferase [Lachnospiraceae bacterium]|nr:putative glycosyltransferase [Lachnospiraceae bacterium]
MDCLYIVMPAYNEEDTIENVIDTWYPILNEKDENSRLVVADNGSVDSTHQVLAKLQQKYPKLEILTDTEKYHGPKLIALYDYAIKNGAKYIFQTDSDGQTNPDEFSEFWNMRNKVDIVLGKRLSRQDGKARKFVENVLCMLLHIYFKIAVPDANAPFRLMKADIVEKYLRKLPKDYNLPNVMLTTYFLYFKENVRFVSISFKPRQGGVNSINIPKIIKIGCCALGDFYKLKKEIDIT